MDRWPEKKCELRRGASQQDLANLAYENGIFGLKLWYNNLLQLRYMECAQMLLRLVTSILFLSLADYLEIKYCQVISLSRKVCLIFWLLRFLPHTLFNQVYSFLLLKIPSVQYPHIWFKSWEKPRDFFYGVNYDN